MRAALNHLNGPIGIADIKPASRNNSIRGWACAEYRDSAGVVRYAFHIPCIEDYLAAFENEDVEVIEIDPAEVIEFEAIKAIGDIEGHFQRIRKAIIESNFPIAIFRLPFANHRFGLIDGNHRAIAAWLQNKTRIKARVYPAPDDVSKSFSGFEHLKG